MRAAVLLIAVGLPGCVDKRTAARLQAHRDSSEPLLRALARGEIRVGDDIGPLIERFPECEVIRHGPWTDLSSSNGYDGTRVVALNGKLVNGSFASCICHDVFFDTVTKEQWIDHVQSYDATMAKWFACRDTLPAAVGVPASILVWRRPSDR